MDRLISRFVFPLIYIAALVASGWYLVARFDAVVDDQSRQRLAALDAVRNEISVSAIEANTFVELMQSMMENEFLERPRNAPPSRLRMALRETEDGAFNLDVLPPGLTKNDVGNLTGLGGLSGRDPEFFAEIEVALSLRSAFRGALTQLPNAAWCYYVSAQRFEHVYPWELSSNFAYKDKDLEQEYFIKGGPELNPSRSPYVTDVYEDDFGKGLMITVGRPVYANNRFMGVVALDFTLSFIDEILAEFPKKFGSVYLIDSNKRVIGFSGRKEAGEKTILPVLFQNSPLLERDNIGGMARTELRGGSEIAVQGMSAFPFALVSVTPAWNIYAQVASGTAIEIMFFFAVVLLLGFIEWRRRIAGRAYEQSLALAKAKEAAEEATKAKSSFLAMMSHEIRTPMNGVLSMAEMLDQTELSEDQRSMASVIRGSATALLTIINDILDFSKIEAGKLHIESIPFSLIEVVEGAGELIAQRADDKGLSLAVIVDSKVQDNVIGDPTRLRQVLLNLLGNAVKFTEAGGVTLRVSTVKEGEVRFEVTDTGIGLTRQQQERLFQAFQQADVSTSRKYGGTGLGLSISQRICHLMHGRIGVQSDAGLGSTFWMEIPLAPDVSPPVKPSWNIADAKIVAVGFHGTTREALAQILSAYGIARIQEYSYDEDVAVLGADLGSVVFLSAQGGDQRALIVGRAFAGRNPPVRGVVLVAPRTLASTLDESDRAGILATVSLPLRRSRVHHVVAVALGRATLAEGSSARGADFEPPTVDEAAAAGALILVAEDNATNQAVIRRMLNKFGYAVEIVGDGQEALDKYNPETHGLILTDFHMPKVDGFELTAALRRNEKGRRVPIIALTADALPGTDQRCLEAGMDGYLTKPIESKLLREALEKWLPAGAPLRRPAVPRTAKSTAHEPHFDPLIFDPQRLIESFGDINSEAKATLSAFLEAARGMAEAVTAALDGSDWDGARHHAHALKGASKSVGAVRLGEVAGEVQEHLDQNDPDTAKLFSDVLTVTVEELIREVGPLSKSI